MLFVLFDELMFALPSARRNARRDERELKYPIVRAAFGVTRPSCYFNRPFSV